MLTFGYDEIRRADDLTQVVVRPNCQVWDGPGSPHERRYACGTLLPMIVLERHRLSCDSTERLLREGRPFVYPLELRANLRTSLMMNPELAPAIPKAVIRHAAAGRAVILLWIGHEPVPFHLDPEGKTWVFDIVQNFVRQHDLPPRQVMLVSGNLLADQSFENWLRDRGLREESAFRFRTLVVSPAAVRMQYRANERGEELTVEELDDVWTCTLSRLSEATFAASYIQPSEILEERGTGRFRPKRFLSMNRTFRLHRQVLVSYLQGKGLLESSIVSFGAAPPDGDQLSAFPALGSFLVESWRALYPKLPLVIDTGGDASTADFHRIAFGWPYRDAYVNLVTETEVAPDVAPICTEKLIKPMLNLQPFIAVTTAQTLRHLRRLGFKTFGHVVNEGYDEVADPVERMLRIFEQIDRIGALSQAEARDLYFACLPELVHNRAHLLEGRHELDALFDALEAKLG